jgi:cytochrome c553
MNVRIAVLGLAVANVVLPLAWAAKLGETAPDLTLKNSSGAQVELSAYRLKRHAVLLAQPSGVRLNAAKIDETCRRLAALDTVVLFLVSDTEAGRRFLDRATSATVLIDDRGTVRQILPGRVLMGPELVSFVETWQSGKTIYDATCARCHGPDGDSTLCEGIKPLVGIGQRLTEAQIRDRMRPGELSSDQVLIRDQILSRQELQAVIAYISGL